VQELLLFLQFLSILDKTLENPSLFLQLFLVVKAINYLQLVLQSIYLAIVWGCNLSRDGSCSGWIGNNVPEDVGNKIASFYIIRALFTILVWKLAPKRHISSGISEKRRFLRILTHFCQLRPKLFVAYLHLFLLST